MPLYHLRKEGIPCVEQRDRYVLDGLELVGRMTGPLVRVYDGGDDLLGVQAQLYIMLDVADDRAQDVVQMIFDVHGGSPFWMLLVAELLKLCNPLIACNLILADAVETFVFASAGHALDAQYESA